MPTQRFLIYLLSIVTVTIMLVVFLQYNSGRNIDQLIMGNESLLAEYKLKNEVQNLLVDLSYISEANEKAINDSAGIDMNELRTKRSRITKELDDIRKLTVHDSTKKYLQRLEMLVNDLLVLIDEEMEQLSNKSSKAFNINKKEKEKLATGILKLTTELNNSRNEHLANLVEEADRNGRQAKTWGIILASLTIIASIFTFVYINNKIKQQQQLIAQLNESEQKVREAATVKENFMANMSHEIRTPMNAILGFTNLLQKEPLNEQSKEFVGNIQSSGENLLTIINDILDFSKIEAGMMRIESNPFSLRGLLHSVETMFGARVKAKNLWFKTEIDAGIPDLLKGDAVRLTQVLVNLVNNAVKFTNEGGIDIKVRGDKEANNNIKVSFSVKDTGIGISPGKIDTVFERFQQAYEESTRKYGGTGLGLSIVKQLVELQSGKLYVTSEPNKGSEFVFTIPFVIAAEAKEKLKQEVNTPGKRISEKKISILVAEDNVMNQNLMKHLLGSRQCDFDIVNNGKLAIEALQQKRYNLVLMDIQMPEMDGYTAAQKIRNELKNDIPIIAMTAHAMAGEREKCLSYGMNEYVSKPIRESELFNIVNQLLSENNTAGNKEEQKRNQEKNFKVLDFDYLYELSGGDKEFESGMITQFLDQVPKEIVAMQQALDKKNYTELSKLAHNMKTSVSFVGLTDKLADALDYIENKSGDDIDPAKLAVNVEKVKMICHLAFEEAEASLHILH